MTMGVFNLKEQLWNEVVYEVTGEKHLRFLPVDHGHELGGRLATSRWAVVTARWRTTCPFLTAMGR